MIKLRWHEIIKCFFLCWCRTYFCCRYQWKWTTSTCKSPSVAKRHTITLISDKSQSIWIYRQLMRQMNPKLIGVGYTLTRRCDEKDVQDFIHHSWISQYHISRLAYVYTEKYSYQSISCSSSVVLRWHQHFSSNKKIIYKMILNFVYCIY